MKNLKFLNIFVFLSFCNPLTLLGFDPGDCSVPRLGRKFEIKFDNFEEIVRGHRMNLHWYNLEVMVDSLSTVLEDSTLSSDPEKLITTLSKFGIDLKQRGPDKCENALHVATSKGKNDVVTFLIKAGLNVNDTNIGGSSPLYLAACYNHLSICRTLLDAGANNNAKNMAAAERIARHYGHDQIAELLRTSKL